MEHVEPRYCPPLGQVCVPDDSVQHRLFKQATGCVVKAVHWDTIEHVEPRYCPPLGQVCVPDDRVQHKPFKQATG
jgi:hypothetical protein